MSFLDRLQPGARDGARAAAMLLVATGFTIAAMFLAWKLSHVLLLTFGAVLVAILLLSLTDLIERYTPARGNWALLLAGLIVLAVIVGFAWILGAQISGQTSALIDQFPNLLRALEQRFGLPDLEEWVTEQAQDVIDGGGVVTQVASYSSVVVGAAANVFLVLVAGVYLALRPDLYRGGLLRLFPRPRRQEADQTLTAVARALRLWLLGQLVAMVLVGLLTGLGLWFLGIPSALALGFLAGLLEFIPFLGPILSAIPAILLALSQDTTTALWVTGLYVLIQQIEGNLITPLVQQHAVDLPPAITIVAIVAFGVLFGFLGVLLATPLAVVVLVVVKKLWVRDTLDEPTELPGEKPQN
jgi:predicted PurR-regulated permease PerM